MDVEKSIVLKTFSNETQAMMVQMNLESMGIDSKIVKDDCGGAYPQLQLSTGVHLIIDSKDIHNAETILKEIEAEENIKTNKSDQSSPYGWVGIFFIGIFTGVLLLSIGLKVYQNDKEMPNGKVDYDFNMDGKPDMTYSYKKGIIMSIEEDRNYDGRFDFWLYYKSGKMERSESDDNFDGKTDGWTEYEDRYNYLSKYDVDFDGIPDATYSIKNGIRQQVDWYQNNSKSSVRREIFKDGVKKEAHIDHDNDGKFDSKIIYDSFENVVDQESYTENQ